MILTIVGPTASGKSALAYALARLVPLEIISADSRQIYRGLDIGTAKPTAAERAAVPHHGIDIVDPAERYSAGRFAADAARWIAEIEARGRLPVVVGGTGLYVRAVFEGIFVEPELDPARRAALGGALERLSTGELQRWARRLDPLFRGDGGRHRAARAIEVPLLAGRPLSELQSATPEGVTPPVPFYVRLSLPRGTLVERIRARVDAMLAAGLVEEVRALRAAGVPDDAVGLTGVGYREAVEHLEGRLGAGAMAAAISGATRRYAKRQETWFRHQLVGPVMVLDATAPPDALAQEVLSVYRAAQCA